MRIAKLATGIALAAMATLGVAAAANSHDEYVKGPFKTGPEVTKACLQCHEKEAKDFMKTVHWTWNKKQKKAGKDVELGKVNAVNNYCIAVPSNWARCTSCHAGYGWKDASFDLNKAENVDCLVCHDGTGKYKKTPTGAGNPDPSVDLEAVAKSVGKPTRRTCGSCHFFGGGGDHVKHGDLDSSLINPNRMMDVHMGVEGKNMTCIDCHKSKDHALAGESLAVKVGGPDAARHLACLDCHKGPKIHDARYPILDKHTARVACATCHVPTMARTMPTKVWWDWSKAGEEIKDPPKDEYGLETRNKMKGEFTWARDIEPKYFWYNGEIERYLLGEKIDAAKVVELNKPVGSRADSKSMLTPFKVMRGKQPYDTKNGYIVVPQLFGGYWKHWDWKKAIVDGMATVNLPFSGEFGWVETEMSWKVNHMVVPKEMALKCGACHGDKGRIDWKALGYPGDPTKVKSVASR